MAQIRVQDRALFTAAEVGLIESSLPKGIKDLTPSRLKVRMARARQSAEKYRDLARRAAAVFKKYGALRVVESWEDDVPEGKVTSFPMAVKRVEGEKVVFSWIEWASRAARDEGMKNSMDELHQLMPEGGMPPFDGQRMIFGGFESIVDVK